MKNKLLKRLGIIVISVAITCGTTAVHPMVVYAEEMENTDNSDGSGESGQSGTSSESGDTIPPIETLNAIDNTIDVYKDGSQEIVIFGQEDVVGANYGYVDINAGIVKQNGGSNRTEANLNSAKSSIIVDNNHYVVSNYSRIVNNNYYVAQNQDQGVIDNNFGKVVENKGTITLNDAKGIVTSNTSVVICNDGGVTNSGKVLANFGKVESDSVVAGSVVVHNFSTGTYDAKTTVENHWWEVNFDNMNTLNTQWKTSEIYDLFHTNGILNSNPNVDINLVSRTDEKKGTKYYAKQGADLVIAPVNGAEIQKPVLYKLGTNQEIILAESDIFFNDASGEWVIRNLSEAVTICFGMKDNRQPSNPARVDVVVIPEQSAQPEQPVQAVEPVQAVASVQAVQPIVMTQVQLAENVTGSREYVAKQAEIGTALTQALNVVDIMTPQQVESIKSTGLAIDAGGCLVADANVSALIIKALNKGIPMNISFAANGNLVNFTIPAGFNISQFMNIDGTIDFVKLFNAILQRRN